MKRAVVFGASGGIGGALVQALRTSGDCLVYAGARSGTGDFTFDLADEASIARSAELIGSEGPLDLLLVTTGLLHRGDEITPEKSWSALDPVAMTEAYTINAIGPALIGKHFLPLLQRNRRAVFAAISARVGSISDNGLGGWHSYRASKAALNMLVRNLALELARRNRAAIAVALHPGTVDTELSKPFQRGVVSEKLFTAEQSAAALLDVIEGLTPADSGGLFAWDGTRIGY